MIGIDLGQTVARVARTKQNGQADVLTNSDQTKAISTGLVVTPEGDVLTGVAAVRMAMKHAEWPVLSLPGLLRPGAPRASGMIAHLLRRIKSDAELRIGDAVDFARLALPAGWEGGPSDTLAAAASEAGLSVRFLPSAVCGVLADYAQRRPGGPARLYVVYDLGTADFSAALLQAGPGTISLCGTTTLPGVGGEAFAQKVVEMVTALVQQQHRIDPLGNSKFVTALRKEAEQAKISLSTMDVADVVLPSMFDRGSVDIDLGIQRSDYERLIEPMVQQTVAATVEMLAASNLTTEDVDYVVTVGASTRTPLVGRMLAETFGAEKIVPGDAAERVALGAALAANQPELRIERAPIDSAAGRPSTSPPSAPVVVAEPTGDQELLPSPAPADAEEPMADQGLAQIEPPAGEAPAVSAPSPDPEPESTPEPVAVPDSPALPDEIRLEYESAGGTRVTLRLPFDLALSVAEGVYLLRGFSPGPDGVMCRARVYLPHPVPGRLTFALHNRPDHPILEATIAVPSFATAQCPVDLTLGIDLRSSAPYLSAVFFSATERQTITASTWKERTVQPPPPAEPAPTAQAPCAGETVAAPAPSSAPAAADVKVASSFEAYELAEQVGASGYHKTYLAKRRGSDTTVVLSVYPNADEHSRACFLNALLPLHVEHPNVQAVLDFGKCAEGFFVVTEFLSGPSLRSLMGSSSRREPVGWDRMAPIAAQLCAGVQALHDCHIIHRNLKPANIVLSRDGALIKLICFDVAAIVRPRDTLSKVSGTISYMSKEVLEGRADRRSDVYAVGVTLYEVLTGRLPFWDESQRQLVQKICSDPPPEPSAVNPAIPAQVSSAIICALAKDPAQRFQSAAELAAALQHDAATARAAAAEENL
jgi:hypothetical protein